MAIVGPNHEDGARAPSGGKAPGAGAEHESPPVMHLEAHHIKKLFKGKMPPIGSKIKVHSLVHVGAYSEGEDGPPSGGKAKGGEGNTKRTMALHFHKMDIAQDGIDGASEESQKKGMKAEMDKALSRGAGGKGRGEGKGKAPAPRGGGDDGERDE
jgi:hypothetical protein